MFVKRVPFARYRSHTDPDVWHYVTVMLHSGYVHCTCPGFHYRKECRHKERAVELLARRYAIAPVQEKS